MARSDRSESPPPAGDRSPAASPAAPEGAAPSSPDPSISAGDIDWAAAAAACEQEATERGQGRDAALLLHQAGRIQEERLGSPEVALACYEGALAVDPTHRPSLHAARGIAAEWGYATRECRLLEAEARITADPRRAAALDHARARLLAGALGKPDEARALLAEAAVRDPGNLALLADHGRLAAAAGRLDELLSDWVQAAEAADDGSAAQILCAAAALAEEALGRPDRAAELALAAFRRSPADPVARALSLRHAERMGRDDERMALLAAEGRQATSPRAAVLAFLQLARAHEERGRPEQALEALAEAQRRAPRDPAVLAERARSAEVRQAWDELAGVLRERVEICRGREGGEDEDLAAAELRLAEVYQDRLGRPDEAAACYRAALEVDPRNRAALSAMGRYHARRGEWEQVLETFLAERDALTDPREQAQRCFKAGELLEERLGRPEAAVGLYAEALSFDPGLLAAARARERLLEQLGSFDELCVHLERELGATAEPSQQIALLFRIARLREDRLGDLAGAALCYRRALELDPAHLVALRSLAVVLERSGQTLDLAVALEHAAAVVKDQREAVALLTRAGEAREEAGDESGAAAAWERALAIDATHLPALRALGRLCARAGRWEELVDMWRAEAQALPSAEAAAALLVRVGEVLETRLARPEEAMAAWREALTLSPAQPAALRSLARLHRSRGELEALVEVLRADADARASPAERAALLFEVAEIWERQIGDASAAAEAHQEALRADPVFVPSHRALQRLLASQARWFELGAACQLEVDHAEGPDHTTALLRLAWVSAERLGDLAAAASTCREILKVDPAHTGAALLLDRIGGPADASVRAALASRASRADAARPLWVAAGLDRRLAGEDPHHALEKALEIDPNDPVAGPSVELHLRTQGRFPDLARLWESRERLAADDADRAECALRSGEAWEDAGEPDRVRAACERSLALAPGSLPALQALRRLRIRAGDWAGVRQALRAEAAACRDPRTAAATLRQAAEVALGRLGDRAAAAEDLRAALGRDPLDAGVAERLVALLQDSGSAADLCELRETRARSDTVPARAAEEWLAAARVATDELADPPRAIADLDQALALRPGWGEALLRRGRLLADQGRAPDAVKDLSACLALGGEPAALVPIHLELAALHQGPLGDSPRAMSHLNAALAAAPEDPQALGWLARVHREAQNWPAAADALRRLVAAPGGSASERVPRLLELAQVQAEGFGDAAAATALCEEALELAPGHAPALELLAEIRERADDLPGVVAVLDRLSREGSDPARRTSARLRAARILAGSLQEPARALALLREALDRDPSSVPAREVLAELLAAESPEQAIEEHRRILEQEPGRVESWRALFALFQRTRAHDRAFVAAGVLRFLQSADPSGDAALYAENAPHAPQHSNRALTEADWHLLRHPLDRGTLSELLALAGEHLAELLPKAAAGDAVRARGGHPVRRLLEELARNFAVDEPTLVEEGEGAGLSLDAAPPLRVRVGAEFARRHSLPEQRFLLARVGARLKARSGLADQLGPGRLGEFLAAAVRQVQPGWAGTGEPGEGLVRQVAKVLPRRLRRPLDDLVARLEPGRVDLIGWYASLAATADRAGLLLASDVPSALLVALRDGAPPPPRPESRNEIREAIRARPDLRMLLCFAASEDHFRLRQTLKMAIA
jgi:tetratricopeptide (TPR) repeat protein